MFSAMGQAEADIVIAARCSPSSGAQAVKHTTRWHKRGVVASAEKEYVSMGGSLDRDASVFQGTCCKGCKSND